MKALVFPGQGAQYVGMAKELYEKSDKMKKMLEQANEILSFRITDIMFDGTAEELKQTKVTQPAIFLHSVCLAEYLKDEHKADMVAGHSLGEFSALVINGSLGFEDALRLVSKRALAMQKACDIEPSTMAAVLGADDKTIEEVCQSIDDEIVVPANYNCPGQVVISGSFKAIETAMEELKKRGAKRVVQLQVNGAFHSPFMRPAQVELEKAIQETTFKDAECPIYQNVTAKPYSSATEIKQNLINQLTSPVLWTQSVQNMIADGATEFIEFGPGKTLQGLIKKINRATTTQGYDQI